MHYRLFYYFSLISIYFNICFKECLALNNGLALTPPMGWMTWQRYRCTIDCINFPNECISETLMKKTADLLVSEGYASAGYNYLILDDCWLANTRDLDGNLQPNKTRFPSGMKSLARYIHDKGLKFGLYEDYGTKTCAGYPGIIGNLKKDALQFVAWDVDYIKLDGCFAEPINIEFGYAEFGQYLNESGKSIVYSCSWPAYQFPIGIKINYTALVEHCNLWRNYDDIEDSWESVRKIKDYFAQNQEEMVLYAGPGHWNDPDMLILGNYGLSYDQSQTQMAIWCILAAPLILSTNLETVKSEIKEIIQNRDAIEINQDSLGFQGKLLGI